MFLSKICPESDSKTLNSSTCFELNTKHNRVILFLEAAGIREITNFKFGKIKKGNFNNRLIILLTLNETN